MAKTSAVSAKSRRTKKSQQKNPMRLSPVQTCTVTFGKISVLLLVGLIAWAYQTIQPPPPTTCGTPGGPSITAPRIKLRDGRHLSYNENNGVPKHKAKYKIIYIHGFDSCKHHTSFFSQELAEELGIYLVSFDRAGYGESDPNPKHTLTSTALDIEELADQLGLGSKFYVIGFSMGGQVVWTCLNYIPNRLAGVGLIAPVVNYWWPGLSSNLSEQAFSCQLVKDQWAFRVAHYVPWLTYWWNTQKWFPCLSLISDSPGVLSPADKKVIYKMEERSNFMNQIRQQGEYVSLHRDLMIGFGRWEFDPVDIKNPFPNNEGHVHIWQGDEDPIVPVSLQRDIAGKLPWIHYHELKGAGHLFPYADGVADDIFKTFLGEK